MHYRPWGTCSALPVQNLGKQLEYFFAEAAAVEFSPGVSKLIEMVLSILKNTVSIVCWQLSYASLLLELRRPICTIFADDQSAGETTTRHLS
jgi:hypothetical protein